MELRHLNLKYALVNICFMLLLSGTMGFAYNFLSQSGFDDGTVGTSMSLVSLFGVFTGPAAADLVDRSQKITQKVFISTSMLATIALAVLLLLIPTGSFLIIPIVIIAFICATVGMPLLNGMAFIYEKAGGVVNFGICRGLGSAAFAVGSNIVGRLWAGIGRNTLPLWLIFAAAVTLVAMQLMPNVPRAAKEDHVSTPRAQSISMFHFFGKYKDFTIVVCSTVLILFCHFLIQNFMAKIIGTFESSGIEMVQGNALFVQAMVELPTMFAFSFLMKKFGIPRIMIVASVFFSLKHVIVLLCGSVPMLYAAMLLQMASFAALIPATVYFSNQMVDETDQNKGQAVFTSASMVGSLIASFVGGWMFQFLDVRLVITIGVISSIAGTALMVVGVRNATRKKALQ